MYSRQHHIKKQLLDFEFGNKTSALKWQQKVPSQYQKEYERAIVKVLDQYDDGRCQQIDKIIVDLGTVTEDQITDKLGKALDNTLKKMMLNIVQHYEIANIDPRTKATVDVKAISSKEELFYIFKYFIAHGNFPWHMTKITVSELEERLQEQFTMAGLTTLLLSKRVFQDVHERTRFFYQFDSKFVNEVFSVYFEKQYKSLKTIIDFCKEQFSKPGFVQHFKKVTDRSSTRSILEWISIFAPENEIFWATAFIPWYMERQWVSEIPFSLVAIWVSTDPMVQRDSTPLFIEQHLKKIFRHLELHLSAIVQENTLEATKDLDKENQPLLPEKTPSDFKTTSDSEREESVTRDEQTKPHEENKNGSSNKTDDDPLANPPYKDGEIKTSNQQNGMQDDIDPINKDAESLHMESPKKDLQIEKSYSTEPSEKDSERFLKNEEKEASKQAEEANKEHESNADETTVPLSHVNHTIHEDNLKNDLTASKEFYKEVEETLDVVGPHETASWEIGNHSDSTYTDPYYIHDAGIVLVWPYLNRLFEKLNYVRDKKFVSKELQERAVMILGYIATGNPICEEHQLVFAKFLCAWPFQMPIKKAVKLKRKELKEADAMLAGLISHWSVLKNTSINGLRETFFYREGKLEAKEDDWKLTVEQKGTDILLDQLPYGISIIKLPWLKKMLRVDWA